MKEQQWKKLLSEGKTLNELSTYDMKDAFSFNRIGYVAGDAILDAARSLGYNKKQQEKIFRSRVSRYFYDNYEKEISTFIKNKFIEFLKKHKSDVEDETGEK